jgi:vacuolar-type H+-ATPase subunit H
VREVIEEILGTEKEAERIVEAARAAAAEVTGKAEADTAQLLAAARDEAQAVLKEEMRRARERAQAAHEALARKAEEENRRFLERQESNILRLVDRVVALVVTPEHARN